MVNQYRELVRVWIMRLSLSTALLVALLSWVNSLNLVDLVIRAGTAFGIMFLLLMAFFSLFEKAAPPEPEKSSPSPETKRGVLLDIAVGDEEFVGSEGQDAGLAGQVDRDLGLPGQVDQDLRAGLQNSKQQAEIVRRMGWG